MRVKRSRFQQPDQYSSCIGRRQLLRNVSAFGAACASLYPRRASAMAAQINVCNAPYLASSNNADNTPAFQAALSYLSASGGGALYIPAGTYNVSSPLTYSGESLTMSGDGQHLSVLVQSHSGVGLTIALANNNCTFTMRDLGMSPCPGQGSWAQCGIAVNVPESGSFCQNVLIENVDLGVPEATSAGQYTSFASAITLTNAARSSISNTNIHANLDNGGVAVTLSGTCCDTFISGSNFDGYVWGVVSSSYSKGLHFTDNVFIGGCAIQTGAADQGNDGTNFQDILIENCELNCSNSCLIFYEVTNASISNSNIFGPTSRTSNVGIELKGCSGITVQGCTFCGAWNPTTRTPAIGVVMNPSALRPTTASSVVDCTFENTCIAVVFGTGAEANAASNIALFQPGLSALVDGIIVYGSLAQQVYVDNSGNTSNNASWLTSTNTASVLATKRTGSQR